MMSQMPSRACAQCGAPLAANQRFCTRCGAVADVLPGGVSGPMPGGQNVSQVTPPLPLTNAFTPQPLQPWGSPAAPSVPGTPSFAQMPSVSGTPSPSLSQPIHASAFPAGQPMPQASFSGPQQMQSQPAFPQQAQAPSVHGMQGPPPQTQMAGPQAQ